MISPELRFDHLDPDGFHHVRRLFAPPPPAWRPSTTRPTPPLVLFLREGKLVKALRPPLAAGAEPPEAVRVDPRSLDWSGPHSLGRLRRAAGAKLAVAIEEEAMERIAAEIDRRVDAGDDLVEQVLAVARAAKAELGRGVLLDPDPFSRIPVPSYAALQQSFDLLLPDDRSAGLFLFDERAGRPGASSGSALWASVVLEKRRGDVVRITSHHALGVEPRDFRDGRHRPVLEAMNRAVAPPHLAIFAGLEAWRDIVGPNPGALAQHIALRNAVVDPAPPWLLALTGAAAMAGVAKEASRLFGRFVPASVKATARAVASSGISPFAALGFDPVALFTELRRLF